MLGAIFLVHLPHGFDIGHGRMEYALTQLLIACALMLTGAGRYSLSLPLPGRWRKCGPALLYLFPAARTRTDSSAGYTEVPVRPPALAYRKSYLKLSPVSASPVARRLQLLDLVRQISTDKLGTKNAYSSSGGRSDLSRAIRGRNAMVTEIWTMKCPQCGNTATKRQPADKVQV
jgi:hypothetical protein